MTKKKYKDNVVNSYYNYTLGIVINSKNERYSNQNIRKALAYGIDKASFEGKLSDDMLACIRINSTGRFFSE